MKLPRTESEYTMFALEQQHHTTPLLNRLMQSQSRSDPETGAEYNALKQEISNWIEYTQEHFPDLVYADAGDYKMSHLIRVAGVLIYNSRSF